MPDEMQQAREVVNKILSGVPRHDREGRVIGDFSEFTDDFFADPSDAEAAQRASWALANVQGMNPRLPEDHEVYQYAPWLLEARRAGPFGYYTGGGWSPGEREAFKQRTGRYPDGRDLSPGDRMVYGRQLDHDTLTGILAARQGLREAEAAPDRYGSRGYRRVVANSQLRQAVENYRNAQGKQGDQAFTAFGSSYPQHQGFSALGDALTSQRSYIGNYLQKGQFTADAAAHAAMSPGVDPLNQAAVTHEGRYHWEAPSPPYVPSGLPPEARDAHIARARKLIEETTPPNYSLSYMREHGEPPSYVGQGLASAANFFADLSLPAMFGAGKAVNATAKGLAKTGLPVLSQYGRHIASKTAPIAAATPAAFATREGMEDGVFATGIQGITTAAQDDRPSFFFPGLRGKPSAWQSGLENRPDIRAALLEEGVETEEDRRAYFAPGGGYDQKIKRSEEAAKELAAMNRQSPESFDKSSTIGRAGSAVGDFAGQLMSHMPPPPKEQPKYAPPSWGPFLVR